MCRVDMKLFIFHEKINVGRRVLENMKAEAALHPPAPKKVINRFLTCEFCEMEGLSTTFAKCNNGRGVLCQLCQENVHSKGKFKTHSTVVILSDEEKERTLGYCTLHPKKPLDVYCYSCETFICMMCFQFGSHCGHSAKLLPDALMDSVGKLSASVDKVITYQTELNIGREAIEKTRSEVHAEFTRHTKEVNDHFAALARALEERKGSILCELANVRDYKEKVLQAQDAKLLHEHALGATATEVVSRRRALIPTFQQVRERTSLCARLDSIGNLPTPIFPKENARATLAFLKRALRRTLQQLKR